MNGQRKYGEWVSVLYYVVLSITILIVLFLSAGTAIFVFPLFGFLYTVPTLYKNQRKRIIFEQKSREWNLYQHSVDISNREQQLIYKQNELNKKQNVLDSQKEIFETLDSIDQYLSLFVPAMDGVVYERYVGYKLIRSGWKNIQYTQRSGDFGVDIIAYTPNGIKTCIQCKRYDGSVGLDAVQEVYSGIPVYGCDAGIVITNSSFTKAAQALAQKTGVQLLDHFE